MKTEVRHIIRNVALAVSLGLTSSPVIAEQQVPNSPDARNCSSTVGPEGVTDVVNASNRFFEGHWWDQDSYGQSSVSLYQPSEISAAVSFQEDEEDALMTAELTDGTVVTGTVNKDRDNLAWFQPEGLVDTIQFETNDGPVTVRLCDTTERVYVPIAANQ